MTSKLTKTTQLKRLKEIRRISAERRLMLARADLKQKESLFAGSQHAFNQVNDEAHDVRMKRLSAIFGAEKDHGAHQALAINTYFQTDEEIENARQLMLLAKQAVDDAEECVKSEHANLARKMLQEDKAERLSHSVLTEIRMEAARQDVS